MQYSSIQAANQLYSKNPLINEIKGEAYDSTESYRLCWVPAHRDITGNEMADNLERETIKNSGKLNKPFLRADFESAVRAKIRVSWLLKWRFISERLNHFREVADNLSPLPNTTSENRRWEVRLACLRLGYTRMTHGYLMSQGGERPVCEECAEEARLTVKHILVECRRYSSHRRRAFGRERVKLREILIRGHVLWRIYV